MTAAGITIIIASTVMGATLMGYGMRPTETLNTTALPGILVAAGGALAFMGILAGLLTMRWKAPEPKGATTLALCASIIAGGSSLTGTASSTMEGAAQDVLSITGMLIAFVAATVGARCILVHQPRGGRRTTTQTDRQEEACTKRLMELVCGECQARGALPGECNHTPRSPGP